MKNCASDSFLLNCINTFGWSNQNNGWNSCKNEPRQCTCTLHVVRSAQVEWTSWNVLKILYRSWTLQQSTVMCQDSLNVAKSPNVRVYLCDQLLGVQFLLIYCFFPLTFGIDFLHVDSHFSLKCFRVTAHCHLMLPSIPSWLDPCSQSSLTLRPFPLTTTSLAPPVLCSNRPTINKLPSNIYLHTLPLRFYHHFPHCLLHHLI